MIVSTPHSKETIVGLIRIQILGYNKAINNSSKKWAVWLKKKKKTDFLSNSKSNSKCTLNHKSWNLFSNIILTIFENMLFLEWL